MELLVVIVIIGILAALLLPAIAKAIFNAKVTTCGNNLKQLFTMQWNYAVSNKGQMPLETCGGFWLKLSQTTPPLIDPTVQDLYSCPVDGITPPFGSTDFRGPMSNINLLGDGVPIGADKVGNHRPGYGGNVVRKSGDVQVVPSTDTLWVQAAGITCP